MEEKLAILMKCEYGEMTIRREGDDYVIESPPDWAMWYRVRLLTASGLPADGEVWRLDPYELTEDGGGYVLTGTISDLDFEEDRDVELRFSGAEKELENLRLELPAVQVRPWHQLAAAATQLLHKADAAPALLNDQEWALLQLMKEIAILCGWHGGDRKEKFPLLRDRFSAELRADLDRIERGEKSWKTYEKHRERLLKALNRLDLEKPLSNDTYEELSPLLRRINQQHLQIDAQMRKLRRKTDEFIQITSQMQEGLVVLDKETNIRSINSAALRIFRAGETCVGTGFFQVNRSNDLRQALNDALDHGHGSVMQELDSRVYRFDMSSIRSDGRLLGAVILAVDVTEEHNAEKLRREFSANVSHELKTPLQGIIGSAELLESGMVKPEDAPRFVGHIRREASRLVNLIEDIIRLSQLDEGVAMPAEAVDMLQLAQEVKAILLPSAGEQNVAITVSGEGFSVVGVRRMLHEVVYNLFDNAIKYNVPGGSVRVHVENNRLTVSDTGIGIPPEHQDRIFERFYRVDKSHSKATGGTGLGLSIVKHAAAYHNAKIALDSTPGRGTTIIIQF